MRTDFEFVQEEPLRRCFLCRRTKIKAPNPTDTVVALTLSLHSAPHNTSLHNRSVRIDKLTTLSWFVADKKFMCFRHALVVNTAFWSLITNERQIVMCASVVVMSVSSSCHVVVVICVSVVVCVVIVVMSLSSCVFLSSCASVVPCRVVVLASCRCRLVMSLLSCASVLSSCRCRCCIKRCHECQMQLRMSQRNLGHRFPGVWIFQVH